jgi:uncharacterized protein YneF (UPF0154 family)
MTLIILRVLSIIVGIVIGYYIQEWSGIEKEE